VANANIQPQGASREPTAWRNGPLPPVGCNVLFGLMLRFTCAPPLISCQASASVLWYKITDSTAARRRLCDFSILS
jgi:hypothetical protein